MKPQDYYATLDAMGLAREPDFRLWVRQPTLARNQFWESFKALYPTQQAIVEEARLLVSGLDATWTDIPEPEVQASFQRLRQKQLDQQPKSWQVWFGPVLFRYAAAVAVLLLAGLGWWYTNRAAPSITYQTAYGEIRTVTLPDGSVVTLNANSRLEVAADWQTVGRREVLLKGEAFFDVTKKPLSSGDRMPFVVHTGAADVVVLGTRFNVNTRRSRMQVVLQEGKVRVYLGRQPDLMLQPGDLVETTEGQPAIRRTRVDADRYVAWRDNLLVMDDEPLQEIFQRMQDQYGLTVSTADQRLLTERFSGTVPADKPNLLLRLIAETFRLRINQEKNQIVLSN
ncbi:FecR family protein [Larkinella bovis]|uniref:FecR family protein n=1 Tax=Larkinella bovis TaxID=683041 RepID=A0ABW0IJ63_9BACT